MSCGNCGSGSCLCPVSLGLALGLTSLLGVIVWTLFALYQGDVDLSWGSTAIYFLIVFVKAFAFGFVLALIYDLIVRRCKGLCCRKSKDDNGGCGSSDCKCK